MSPIEATGGPESPPTHRGRIRIDGRLGRGGMGTVYLGFDERLERQVALKVLHPAMAANRRVRERFLREARLLSQLQHPGICQIHDLFDDGGETLLVLEYVPGPTLAEALPTLEEETKIQVAIGILEAVAAAHRQRIVHRDLKPQNVLLPLTDDGSVAVKVLDFGLARSALSHKSEEEPEEPTVSDPPSRRRPLAGTLRAMSPEQARRLPVTEASDLFSFGLLLQEMLTGRPAYPPGPKDDLWPRILTGRTEPAIGVDPVLGDLLRQLLRMEPELRPTADEALAVLRRVLERPTARRRRRRRVVLAGAVVLALAAATFFALDGRRRAHRQADAARHLVREATDIEWQLRSAYLGPPRDLQPLHREVRARLERLRQQTQQLGSAGRGPGEYALARAAVALGDSEAAARHLDSAWRSGYRTPEVATARGLVGLHAYRSEAEAARRLRDPTRRRERLEALDRDRLQPALEALDLGRGARSPAGGREPTPGRSMAESPDYVTAVAALERGDEAAALAAGEAALERDAWLYEAALVIAQVHARRADRESDAGAVAETIVAFEAERTALERAAAIGRSDPRVHVARCDLEGRALVFQLYGPGETIEPHLQAGTAACQRALDLDQDNPEPWRLLSELHMRQAESIGGDTTAGRQALQHATEAAQEALRRAPDDADAWRSLGHVQSVEADARLGLGRDATAALERLVTSYSEAYRLAPGEVSTTNALGNAYSMRAENAFAAGDDGTADIDRAIELYEQVLELDPSPAWRSNLALAHARRALFEVSQGLDPSRALAAGLAEQQQALAENPMQSNGMSNRIQLETIAARAALGRGDDPVPALLRALDGCRSALDAQLATLQTARLCGQVMRATAERALLCGDMRPAIDLEPPLLGLDEISTDGPALVSRAATLRLAALSGRPFAAFRPGPVDADAPTSGAAPAVATLDDARAALALALEREPATVAAWLERGRIELAEAVVAGSEPRFATALDRAGAAFDQAHQRRPRRPEPRLGLVQVEILRARASGVDRNAALRRAAEHLEALEATHPGRPEIAVLRDDLNRLRRGDGPNASLDPSLALPPQRCGAPPRALDG